MAKTAIHEQNEALSVYFQDMLAEPEKAQVAAEAIVTSDVSDIDEESEVKTDSQPARTTEEPSSPSPVTDKQNYLLCVIGGMPLAIPVSTLNNIVHWPAQGLSQLPGQVDWQLGVLTVRDQHCEVLDIRQLLQAAETTAALSADYILLLDQGRRGIACNAIEHIQTIHTEDINWRQDRSQRTWFLGVLNESMHSIVDIEALLGALDNGEMA